MSVGRLRLWAGRVSLPRRLKRRLPPAAREIMTALSGAGFEAWLVGGCVRDLLLGLKPKDWDIASNAGPEAILALYPHGRVMGSTRGGNTVLIPLGGEPYEVTPYRGADLEEDLARRDLTMNAMALGLEGDLRDPLGGLQDLAVGLVRACGEPEARMSEDPLRMLRAVRLAAQFRLSLDDALCAAIGRLAPSLGDVAPERIGAEWARLLVTDLPAWGMERLRELGLLAAFAPEVLEMVGFHQNRYHRFTVWEHVLLALALVPPQLPLRLAALLHDMGKPHTLSVDEGGGRHFYRHEQVGAEMAAKLLERLRFEGEARQRVVHLVRYHMDLHFDGEVGDRAIRRMVRRIGLEYMHDLIQLRRADRLASGMRAGDLSPETVALLQQVERILQEDSALKVTDLAVDGHDVMQAFRRPAGPFVGRVLERLLDEVMDDPSANERERLLGRLTALAGEWKEA